MQLFMYLAERIVLTKGIHKEEYKLADCAAPLAKLLYNAALFHVRQIFTGWDKEVRMEKAKDDKDIVVLCSDSRGSASLTDFFNKKQQEFPQPLQVVG